MTPTRNPKEQPEKEVDPSKNQDPRRPKRRISRCGENRRGNDNRAVQTPNHPQSGANPQTSNHRPEAQRCEPGQATVQQYRLIPNYPTTLDPAKLPTDPRRGRSFTVAANLPIPAFVSLPEDFYPPPVTTRRRRPGKRQRQGSPTPRVRSVVVKMY